MSFYTSNSSFFRKLVLIPVILLVGYVVLGFALDYLVLRRTTSTMYTRLPDPKVKHMNLNHKKGELDVVFLGSSRTEYHMSQKSFSDKGMQAYNLGFSGAKLSSYASLLNKAIKAKPTKIVLSLSVQTLYRPDWDIPTTTDLDSFLALRVAGVDFLTQMDALWKLLEGTNRLRIYADAITGRVKGAYKKFDPNTPVNAVQTVKNAQPAFPFGDDECVVAQVTKYSSLKDIRSDNQSIKCTNGDSILTGNKLSTKDLSKYEQLVDLQTTKIAYLNELSKRAAAENIEFILVLEPSFYTDFSYDINTIQNVLKPKVLDNTSIYRDDIDLWFDAGHLRYEGKKKYSKHLATQLK